MYFQSFFILRAIIWPKKLGQLYKRMLTRKLPSKEQILVQQITEFLIDNHSLKQIVLILKTNRLCDRQKMATKMIFFPRWSLMFQGWPPLTPPYYQRRAQIVFQILKNFQLSSDIFCLAFFNLYIYLWFILIYIINCLVIIFQMFTEQKLQFEAVSENQANRSKHYGNTIPLGIDQNGQAKYLLGPHYYIFFIAWICALGGLIYVIYILIPYCHIAVNILNCLSSLGFLYYYAKTAFSLPGLASSGYEPDFETKTHERYCVPCKIIREPGCMHCIYCDVCIYKMDHHCPWVGKCIGRDNITLFYKFLIAVSLMMVILIVSAVTAKVPSANL